MAALTGTRVSQLLSLFKLPQDLLDHVETLETSAKGDRCLTEPALGTARVTVILDN